MKSFSWTKDSYEYKIKVSCTLRVSYSPTAAHVRTQLSLTAMAKMCAHHSEIRPLSTLLGLFFFLEIFSIGSLINLLLGFFPFQLSLSLPPFPTGANPTITGFFVKFFQADTVLQNAPAYIKYREGLQHINHRDVERNKCLGLWKYFCCLPTLNKKIII